jgi:hypothetical protein
MRNRELFRVGWSDGVCVIENYSGSEFKNFVHTLGAYHTTDAVAGGVRTVTWKNTSAITDLSYTVNGGGNFIAGSYMEIYGEKEIFIPAGTNRETVTATKELARVTVTSAQASINFTGIDQTYDRLFVKYRARTDRVDERDAMVVEFNNDITGSNYHTQLHYAGNGSAVVTEVPNQARVGLTSADSAPVNAFASGTIIIDGYTDSNWKQAVTDSSTIRNTTSLEVGGMTGSWHSTAAITEMDLTPETGTNFVSGSEFILYGEKKVTLGGSGGGVVEEFRAYGGAGFATASAWPYFTTTEVNTISTYGTITNDATDGVTFTASTDCVIYISATLLLNETASWGFSLNEVGGDKNVAWSSLTAGTGLRGVSSPVAGWFSTTSDSVKLSDGDFVKIHVQSGKTFAASDRNGISILVSPA